MIDTPFKQLNEATVPNAPEAKYVVGMGEALWDVLPEGKQIGGAPANFAFHVSQLGIPTRVVSAVGNDALGLEVHQVFAERNLEGLVADVPYPTGTVQVTVDQAGVPNYEIKEGVAWDNIPFTPELQQLALETRAVCWGSLAQRSIVSRETILRFVDTMPDEPGRLKIFDINLRQSFYSEKVLEDSFKRCNMLKINDEELVAVSRLFGIPGTDLEEKCRYLITRYKLQMLILTCGVNGSYIFTPAGTCFDGGIGCLTPVNTSFVETPKVEVADTVGAGDSFTAALTVSLLQGMPVSEAHQRAVRVSAYVCTQRGAMPILPNEVKG